MPRKAVICLYCGKSIKSGRIDKKFCNSGCKDAYNNEQKESERNEIRAIDLIIKKNRRVLKRLYNPKYSDRKVSKEELIREGFEFGFLTHVAVTITKSNEIIFCYDYGFREITKDKFRIYPSFSKVQVKDRYHVKVY